VYKINFTRQAAKSIRKIPKHTSDLIREKLEQLASDPFDKALDIVKLQNRPGYRMRVGNWRILYELQKENLIIIVLNIASRGDVYR